MSTQREDWSRSLLRFGKAITPDMFTSASPDFHLDMDAHLRDVSQQNTVIVAPRAHAKSSIVACLLVLWHIFLEDTFRRLIGAPVLEGAKFVVIISKTRREAQKRLDTIKRTLGDQGEFSAPFRNAFGNWGIDSARLWNQNEIVLKDGTMIVAMGTGQQARGLKSGHRRVTLIVGDDCEDRNNTGTSEAMLKNRRWLFEDVLPSLDEKIGRAIVIGTPLNTQCMVVKLRDTVGWRALWYRNDADNDTSRWFDSASREWKTYKGVLWPHYISRKKLLARKAQYISLSMVASYYREWEAVVVGNEEQIFRPEYLKSWYGEFHPGDQPWIKVTRRFGKEVEEEKIPVLMFTGVDPASSVSATADRTVICNIAVDAEDNIYVLPCTHRRLHPDKVVDSIAQNHKQFKPYRGIVEVSASYEFVWAYLRRDHKISYLRDRPRTAKKGEGSRLESLQPHFAGGKFWVWETPDVFDVAKEQLLSYPNGRDDWLDGLEKAFRIRKKPWHTILEESEQEDESRYLKFFDPMMS